MTEPDSPDTVEQKAYRRGKAAGYSIGIVAGWDACVRHMRQAFENAMAESMVEPDVVSQHRLELTRNPATENEALQRNPAEDFPGEQDAEKRRQN